MNRFAFLIALALSYLSAFFAQSAGNLFTARFARLLNRPGFVGGSNF